MWMTLQGLVDRPAHTTGPVAVNDAQLIEPRQQRVVQRALQNLQGFLDATTVQVDLTGRG